MTKRKHLKGQARLLADHLGIPYASALRMIRQRGQGRPARAALLAASPNQGHVFISYVREDSAPVDELQHVLEAAGIPVWRDTTSLWPGENWQAKIRNAISHDALVFIACFSSRIAGRRTSYMNEELLLAVDQLRLRRSDDPWLIPVRFDDCDVPDLHLGAGRTLAEIQRADLFGAERDLAVRRLVAAVQRLLQQPATPPPGGLPVQEPETQSDARPRPPADALALAPDLPQQSASRSVDRILWNVDAPWNKFSSDDYWRRNYQKLQAEDQEIIRLVSNFFIGAFVDRPSALRGIDVGSGTNLYPALLMLPWAEQILLTDYAASNVDWLRGQLADDGAPWTWGPFWNELREAEGYNEIGEPRKQLRWACDSVRGRAGVEQRSVFDLPAEQWDLGTMFFVAESITEDPAEFRGAVAHFVGALKPGAPFAAAFMAGSHGYPVADTHFPALPITPKDVELHLCELGTRNLSVERPGTRHPVRPGYEGMIVATGFTSGR